MKDHVPLPQKFYSSPFRRSTQTLNVTWHDILLDKPGYAPRVKESFREAIGLMSFEIRSNKSTIAAENRE